MSGLQSRSHDVNADNLQADATPAGSGGVQRMGNLVTSLGMLITRCWRKKAMVYVERDAQGHLLRVEQHPFEGSEHIAVESEELQTWLKMREEVKARLDSLNATDLELVRVLEDVVNVLVDRGVIQYTDLPQAAREKLDQRAVARADLEGLNTMLHNAGE